MHDGNGHHARQDDKAQNKVLWEGVSWQPGNVVAVAKNNGKEVGKVGLLGPKRMDYSNSMAVLDVLLKDLNGGESGE